MDFHKEILSQMLSRYEIKVFFPQLGMDIQELFKLECYQALKKIKAILEDEGSSDAECLAKIEEVVHIFEDLGSDCGERHDFG